MVSSAVLPGALPVFACEEDALRAAVEHAGGAKKVGPRMWGDLAPDTAARKLMDALNPARAERLKPSQVLLVLRLAHEAGYHAAAQWLMGECGYAVQVVEPVAQVDRAMAAVEFAAKALTDATAMLERAQRMRVAA